jgi:hypothetical protein
MDSLAHVSKVVQRFLVQRPKELGEQAVLCSGVQPSGSVRTQTPSWQRGRISGMLISAF